jgi:hypothetical protein
MYNKKERKQVERQKRFYPRNGALGVEKFALIFGESKEILKCFCAEPAISMHSYTVHLVWTRGS